MRGIWQYIDLKINSNVFYIVWKHYKYWVYTLFCSDSGCQDVDIELSCLKLYWVGYTILLKIGRILQRCKKINDKFLEVISLVAAMTTKTLSVLTTVMWRLDNVQSYNGLHTHTTRAILQLKRETRPLSVRSHVFSHLFTSPTKYHFPHQLVHC